MSEASDSALGRLLDHLVERPPRDTISGEANAVVDDADTRRALRGSEAHFREVADFAPVIMWVTDADGACTFLNHRWHELTGQTPEAALDLGWLSAVHPEDAAVARAAFLSAMAGREPFQAEYRLRRRDGEWRWMIDLGTPRFDPAGEFLGFVGSVVDVTDRKQAEEQLRQSERQLRTLIENVTVGVALIDETGQFTLYNHRFLEMFGLSPSSTLANVNAQDWGAWQVLDEEGRLLDIDEHPVRRAVRTGRAVTGQLVGVRRPGGRGLVWMLVSAGVISAEGAAQVICTYQDITAQKEAEQAVREADKRKTDFLAVLSHELRNPLAPIRNSIVLLDRAPPGSDPARRARGVLHRQTEHLARLVDDLLEITRISHGKIELQLSRLDARDVVRRACDDLRAVFEQRGVELRYSEAAEPAWVEADAARLAQMVGNLLNNALKFTPPGGQVHGVVRKRAGACEVSVRDTGIGIEPGDLDRIFDAFVQAERTRHGSQGGLGIGLALVRELVVQHGGAVHATSAGPGQGAELVLTLPLVAAPAEDAARSSQAGQGVSGLSILIVEDNEDAGATLADLLALTGNEVKLVSTGRAGIAAASASAPDVLICDVGLPDLSGFEVIRAIRGVPSAGRVFAIALTGYAQPQDRRQALDAGFDAHLPKPPPLEQLQELLAEAERRRP